jgi:hypothetical protein
MKSSVPGIKTAMTIQIDIDFCHLKCTCAPFAGGTKRVDTLEQIRLKFFRLFAVSVAFLAFEVYNVTQIFKAHQLSRQVISREGFSEFTLRTGIIGSVLVSNFLWFCAIYLTWVPLPVWRFGPLSRLWPSITSASASSSQV